VTAPAQPGNTTASPLRQALHDYSSAVEEALRPIPAEVPQTGPLPQWGIDEEGRYHRRIRWPYLPLGGEMALQRLPSYETALVAAREDERTAPRMDALMGTILGRSTYQPHMLLVGFAMEVARACRGRGWDEAAFEAAYAKLEQGLGATTRDVRAFTPLVGLQSELDGPIDLGSGTVIDRLSEDEVVACLTVGAIPTHFDFYADDPPLWGIRITRTVPLLIGPMDEQESGALTAWYEGVRSERTVAMTSLRLARAGRLRPIGNLVVGQEAGAVLFDSLAPEVHPFPSYTLQVGDGPVLKQIADELRDSNVRANGSFQNALRRFVDAGQRSGDEDRIIDLMIAAESLFVDTREGEVTFRMSLNGAWFVGTDAAERRAVHHLLKSAYGVRSDVVHGNEVTAKSRRRRDGTDRNMSDFVGDVEAIIRAALRKALPTVRGLAPGESLADWSALTVGADENREGWAT
jgi:hypothetical protein